jgi:GTP cyclohydrolase II
MLSMTDAPSALSAETTVSLRRSVEIPLKGGAMSTFMTFDGFTPAAEHFAVKFGTVAPGSTPWVRLHSECITGDVFGSLRCDCGAQLSQAVDALEASSGLLLYLRQEGRGIGLLAKMDAYKLQDGGLDTFAANEALSLPADARDYACAAAMLKALGITRIRLISNNPDKAAQLERYGVEVLECERTSTFVNAFNRRYLEAKVRVTGHRLEL